MTIEECKKQKQRMTTNIEKQLLKQAQKNGEDDSRSSPLVFISVIEFLLVFLFIIEQLFVFICHYCGCY